MARKANTGATFTMMHHGRVAKSIAPAGVLVAVFQLRYVMLPFQGDPAFANVLAAEQAEFVLSGFSDAGSNRSAANAVAAKNPLKANPGT